jgi:hypothetical protein
MGVEGEGDGPSVGKACGGGGGAPEGCSVSDLAPTKEEMGRGGGGARGAWDWEREALLNRVGGLTRPRRLGLDRWYWTVLKLLIGPSKGDPRVRRLCDLIGWIRWA